MFSAICLFISPVISAPTFIIVNRAIYRDKPFPLKANTMKIGMIKERVVFFSIKIFLTAGSSSHAIAAVHPATIIDNINDKNIFLKCFLTYSLYNRTSINLISLDSISIII